MKRRRAFAILAVSILGLAFLGAGCCHCPQMKGNRAPVSDSQTGSQTISNPRMLWQVTSTAYITHKPLVDGRRVYFADWGGTVYAADAASGSVIWKRTVETTDPKWAWRGFSGTGALGRGLLFEASAEGSLFALDVATGDVKWETRFTDKPVAGNTGALLYYNGTVYVPVSSMDEGLDQQEGFVTDFQGSVEAFDAATGKKLWEFKTVTGSGNGAAVWSGFAVDPDAKTLYFDSGNNYTGKATEMSDAIIAVDAMTGSLKWAKQCTANDVWTMAQPQYGPDYDFAAAPQLFEAKIDGKERKLVAAGQKSGTLWVLDRTDGTLVWSAPLGTAAPGGGFLAPVSIDAGGIYAWANNAFKFAEPEKYLMDIAALDLATGKVLWKQTHAQPAWVTTAGVAARGRYFVGSLDGKIRAYDTKTGALTWTSDPMASISTSLTAADGRLYFGTGIPAMFGGSGEGGVVYCLQLKE